MPALPVGGLAFCRRGFAPFRRLGAAFPLALDLAIARLLSRLIPAGIGAGVAMHSLCCARASSTRASNAMALSGPSGAFPDKRGEARVDREEPATGRPKNGVRRRA